MHPLRRRQYQRVKKYVPEKCNGHIEYWPGFFTALGDGKVFAVISFLRTFLFQVSVVLILPALFDISGVWAAIVAAEQLSGGCGGSSGKPQIEKTPHLQEAYEFGKSIYQEQEEFHHEAQM